MCDLAKKTKKKHSLQRCLCECKCTRMGWYLDYYCYRSPYVYVSMDARTQRQHSTNVWYGGVTNDRLRHNQLAAA